MIAVRLEGRLGNQLFQYAFIYSAGKKLNTKYYIDQYIEPSIVDKYFEVEVQRPDKIMAHFFGIDGFKNIFRFHLRRFYYKSLAVFNRLTVKQLDIKDSFAEARLQDNCIYKGYFQSELFFKPYESLIRDKFKIKPKFIKEFNLLYNDLYTNNTIVTIHIRRTDYKDLQHLNLGGNDLSLPVSYYNVAISKYNLQDVHFVFISDDHKFVEENFGYIKNKTISVGNEITDLQHLLYADECIISNSTFSWWGAWLNNKPNKVIYAPKYCLGWRIKQEYPLNIYPAAWNLIDPDER